MALTRRTFLSVGALGLLASSCPRIWTERAQPESSSAGAHPLLVVVFLRGGADGLHLVPPIGDPDYARTRQGLALRETLPFAPGFGLHPAMTPLLPLVERGQLAVIHATGSPNPTRSHFQAQDFMDMGNAGEERLRAGWLARALEPRADAALFDAVALGSRVPLSLRGADCFAFSDPARFGLRSANADERAWLERLYAEAEPDIVTRSALRGFEAVRALSRAVDSPGYAAVEQSSRSPLARRAEVLFALDASGLRLRAVELEAAAGWDTHASQGTETGGVSRPIGQLAEGLARIFELAGEQREVIVVVKTEFGRTARPNGSGGTDHGHGAAILVAGQSVRGGLYGDWPGLAPDRLHEGRDLAVTTDYRDVLAEVLAAHLGHATPPEVFPGYATSPVGFLA